MQISLLKWIALILIFPNNLIIIAYGKFDNEFLRISVTIGVGLHIYYTDLHWIVRIIVSKKYFHIFLFQAIFFYLHKFFGVLFWNRLFLAMHMVHLFMDKFNLLFIFIGSNNKHIRNLFHRILVPPWITSTVCMLPTWKMSRWLKFLITIADKIYEN